MSGIYAPYPDRAVYVRFCDKSGGGKRAGRLPVLLPQMVKVTEILPRDLCFSFLSLSKRVYLDKYSVIRYNNNIKGRGDNQTLAI